MDVLFVGPVDLSYALGVPGMFDAPEFRGRADRRGAGGDIRPGSRREFWPPDRDRALECVEAGFTFVAIASDSALLAARRAGRAPDHDAS